MLMIKRFAEMKCINVKKTNKHKNCLVKINFRLHKKPLAMTNSQTMVKPRLVT